MKREGKGRCRGRGGGVKEWKTLKFSYVIILLSDYNLNWFKTRAFFDFSALCLLKFFPRGERKRKRERRKLLSRTLKIFFFVFFPFPFPVYNWIYLFVGVGCLKSFSFISFTKLKFFFIFDLKKNFFL